MPSLLTRRNPLPNHLCGGLPLDLLLCGLLFGGIALRRLLRLSLLSSFLLGLRLGGFPLRLRLLLGLPPLGPRLCRLGPPLKLSNPLPCSSSACLATLADGDFAPLDAEVVVALDATYAEVRRAAVRAGRSYLAL